MQSRKDSKITSGRPPEVQFACSNLRMIRHRAAHRSLSTLRQNRPEWPAGQYGNNSLPGRPALSLIQTTSFEELVNLLACSKRLQACCREYSLNLGYVPRGAFFRRSLRYKTPVFERRRLRFSVCWCLPKPTPHPRSVPDEAWG